MLCTSYFPGFLLYGFIFECRAVMGWLVKREARVFEKWEKRRSLCRFSLSSQSECHIFLKSRKRDVFNPVGGIIKI